MIVLNKDIQSNTIFVTLREMQCINTDKYLLELQNNTSRRFEYAVLTDISGNPSRFQQFVVTLVTASANPLSGSLNLPLEGFYSYTFYQLDPLNIVTGSAGLTPLEFGKALVISTVPTGSVYESSVNPTRYVYESEN
jgi:hypothetical protein